MARLYGGKKISARRGQEFQEQKHFQKLHLKISKKICARRTRNRYAVIIGPPSILKHMPYRFAVIFGKLRTNKTLVCPKTYDPFQKITSHLEHTVILILPLHSQRATVQSFVILWQFCTAKKPVYIHNRKPYKDSKYQ